MTAEMCSLQIKRHREVIHVEVWDTLFPKTFLVWPCFTLFTAALLMPQQTCCKGEKIVPECQMGVAVMVPLAFVGYPWMQHCPLSPVLQLLKYKSRSRLKLGSCRERSTFRCHMWWRGCGCMGSGPCWGCAQEAWAWT